jgi:multidrug efflux pump subunit AcrB
MIMALGISSLLNMPKAEDPVLKATFNSIVVVYPGTSPEDMEKLILEPIEDKMSSIADIKKMISYANDGVATIIIEFNHNVKEDEKNNEVLRELNSLKSKLPQDIFAMDVFKYTPETVNIIQAAFLSETASYNELKSYAEDLKTEIKKIKNEFYCS